MGIVENTLKPLDGYMVSLDRDTINGWYELKIGIYSGWVYNSNKDIECTLITENESGKIIKISPKHNKIICDDLIEFAALIIKTNEKIAEKELEFKKRLEDMKRVFEKEVESFNDELENLKEKSFKMVGGENSEKTVQPKKTPKKPIVVSTINDGVNENEENK